MQRSATFWATAIGLFIGIAQWFIPDPLGLSTLSTYQRLLLACASAVSCFVILKFLLASPVNTSVWRWRSLVGLCAIIIVGVGWVGTQLQTSADLPVPPQPANMYQRFDFEHGIGDWKLELCRDDPCRTNDTTNSQFDEIPNQLFWGQTSFTGEHSLEVQVEIRPDREQYYIISSCPTTKAFADAVTANIYVPERQEKFTNYLLIAPVGGGAWAGSSLDLREPGWHRLSVDMRLSVDENHQPFNKRAAVDCITFHLLVPKASSQKVEKIHFFIDDIELFKPLSKQP